jgi:hypothetical protein
MVVVGFRGEVMTDKPGTERIAVGLYRVWYQGRDIGLLEWQPRSARKTRWQCEAGKYLTQAMAIQAMVKAVGNG